MARRFLYASTISYSDFIYANLPPKSFSEIYALTVLVNNRQKGFLSKKPFSNFYIKLCRNQRASILVDRHYSLGFWQFYLPLRNRIFRSPASSLELSILSYIYTRKLNKILPLVDVAIVSSDFSLNRLHIPPSTQVYLECRSHHKGINSKRPPIELECPYQDLHEGPGEWERNFERRKGDFAGFITYSSVSAKSFCSAGIDSQAIQLAPLPLPKIDKQSTILRQPKTLLWVGRGYPSKGLDIAVQISKELGLKLTVVGVLHPNVVKWLQEFPNVNYLGRLDKVPLFKQMQSNEIFIMPSIESYGLAVYEALTNGMKVVASPYVGIIDWMKNHPNLYVSDKYSLPDLIDATLGAIDSALINTDLAVPVSEFWQKTLRNM